MQKPVIHLSDLDRTGTWLKYRNGLCNSCMATCCTMPVEVKLGDLVRMNLVDAFEAENIPAKDIAKRLTKTKVIAQFNFKQRIFTLARRANGDCTYLNADTRRCTIYDQRPNTCRNHPRIGPRPDFCAYRTK
ncbi:YkgJ family cysteine cluster protein [Chitinimonas sp. BJB300]|uniref:YkgJ family cysteine cluster protein n=1 Tax=Chitinimonas sp. BJB300 TaxID=1559339 RepID=UPI000C0EF657|nr:YkgJ family cysteine cluster protein [Chitinimonas sp. BJB300]PHV09825.1 Fe-S-oxidoreductase [Chitinimonas sp. BJB300]TSJ87360.1 YkgJ family cysteine cluster protein [Chitinimonas sp. BJB300]